MFTLGACKDQIVSKLFEDKQPTTINNLTIHNNTTIIQSPDGEKKEKSINVELDEELNLTIEEQQQMIECLNDFLEIVNTKKTQTEE